MGVDFLGVEMDEAYLAEAIARVERALGDRGQSNFLTLVPDENER
jgi:hypothetical protein